MAMFSVSTLFDVAGRNAIVTGASRGLGRGAAEALAEAGANVALMGRDTERLKEAAEELKKYGTDIFPVRCDVTRPRQITAAIGKAAARFGRLDVLVNNAGVIARYPAADYPLDEWNRVIETNLTGVFLMAQSVGRIMLEQKSGKIINIASLLSFSGGKNVPAYTAGKHGVAGITKALSNEWAGSGVNVNAIAPGYFHTDATEALRRDRKRYRELTARIPAGRWGEPDDLKGAIIFLSSRASDYVHGHILTVDGGWQAS